MKSNINGLLMECGLKQIKDSLKLKIMEQLMKITQQKV